MEIERILSTVIFAGISIYIAVNVGKGIRNVQEVYKVISYLLAFCLGITIVELVVQGAVGSFSERFGTDVECLPSQALMGGYPAYLVCGGFFVPGVMGTGLFRLVSAARQYLLTGAVTAAAAQVILLKLKIDLAKTSFAGTGPVFMSFLTAALTYTTLYHSPEILNIMNQILGRYVGSSLEGMECFFLWLAKHNTQASENLGFAMAFTAGFWISAVKLVVVWFVYCVFMVVGAINFVLYFFQSCGLVLLPLSFIVLFILGAASWKTNLKIIGMISLVSLLAVGQNFILGNVMTGQQCSLDGGIAWNSPAKGTGPPIVQSTDVSIPSLAQIEAPLANFNPNEFLSFLNTSLLAILLVLLVSIAVGIVLTKFSFIFLLQQGAVIFADAMGSRRGSDWIANLGERKK